MATKRLFISLLIPGLFSLSTRADSTEDINAKYPGYKLAFNEEFSEGVGSEKDEVDHDVWNFEYGFMRNNEDQCYMDRKENAFIKDGNLVIRALDINETANPFYDRNAMDKRLKKKNCYTSASLQSKQRFHYGIWETRAKIPVGDGLWPAIWGCGNSRGWPSAGELDVMEYYGDAIHANLAWGDDWQHVKWNSRAPRMSEFDKDFADKYHIWRTEWDHNSLRIYLDDRLLNETNLDMTVNSDGYNPYRDADNGFEVWLNLALGGNNGGNPASPSYPADYLVDYTRVYVPESADAALVYRIHKASTLLEGSQEGDAPGSYPAAACDALSKAIEVASGKLGASDDETIDTALDKLQMAMDTFIASQSTGIIIGEPFTLVHEASGCMLASGFFDGKDCVVVAERNLPDFNYTFKFVEAPSGAEADGYNLMTGDGKYVRRDSWNLYLAKDDADLKSKNCLFRAEAYNGKILIKNFGTGKYFGTDDVVSVSHVYSDKAGAGNYKGYFTLDSTGGGVEGVYEGLSLPDAVYDIFGNRVANSLQSTELPKGIYIVVSNGKTFKIAL